MAIPRIISDLAGTARTFFKLGIVQGTGAAWKAITGGLVARDVNDSADAPITGSELRASGDSIKINSDAAGSGADWELSIERPATGMTADVTLVLPPDEGSPGDVLTTDGSGNASWAAPAVGSPNGVYQDDTAIAFGDSSPIAMFTKPAGSKVALIRVQIVTPYDGAAPTLSIGITGTTSKYGTTGQVDLKAATGTVFEWDPGEPVAVSSEPLIGTYNADSSAAGAAIISVFYVTPT